MSFAPIRRLLGSCVALLGLLAVLPGSAAAGGCHDCGKQCGKQELTCCTVMVPALVVETRMETRVTKVKEQREEKYTAFVKKPVTRKFMKETCYLENDVKTTLVEEMQCQLVTVPVERNVAVKVPYTEIREVPICKPGCDHCTAKGGAAAPLTKTCEVVVEKTEMRQEITEEVRLAIAKSSHEITYCVKVPKKREELCVEEISYELVPVEQTRLIEVCVPRVEKYPVEVVVCKMVPKKLDCCSDCAGKYSK